MSDKELARWERGHLQCARLHVRPSEGRRSIDWAFTVGSTASADSGVDFGASDFHLESAAPGRRYYLDV